MSGLIYDFDLPVFDWNGEVLVSKLQQGKENLGGADPFALSGASLVVPRFRRMPETLFREPEVVKALQP